MAEKEQALLIAMLIENDKTNHNPEEEDWLNQVHRRLFAFGADGKYLRVRT